MKLFLKLAFAGTNYHGYQVQDNAVTVQGTLNEATELLFGFPCDIVGCSRTDSGVHATAFAATVTARGTDRLDTSVPVEKIPLALNNLLPPDLSVLKACMVSSDFHARYDVKRKEYEYKIWNGACKNPFLTDRALHVPKHISDDMLASMNEAAAAFVGMHDFTAFMAAGSKITDACRTVYYADVRREGDMLIFRVSANGFLYHMVRIMMGTLLGVAEGRLLPADMKEILASHDRTRAGATAPAHGLYLNKVLYGEEK